MPRDYNSEDYEGYENPYDQPSAEFNDYERSEDRLRARFEQMRQGRRYSDPYNYDDIDQEDYQPSDSQFPGTGNRQGCSRWLVYGGIVLVLFYALFKGGLFQGEISLPRRGCNIIITVALAGFVMLAGAVWLNDSNESASWFLGICGSLLCLGGIGGIIFAFVMGTRLLSLSGVSSDGFNIGDIFENLRGN